MREDQEKIDKVIATFPETFGLYNFPGEVFRLSRRASYFTGFGGSGTLMLYTERRQKDGSWLDFAKGTESELRREVVELPKSQKKSKAQSEEEYRVVVGNVGTVYSGFNRKEAKEAFHSYVEDSEDNFGRAGGEDVALFEDDEIIDEHLGHGS
jgi:hypothetical protein